MLTNNLGLPFPLVAAITNDPYDNFGTLSLTTLLKPAQANALLDSHGGEIVEDAADRIWSLVGQVGHTIIERAAAGLNPERYITERRFFMDLPDKSVPGYPDPLRISGAADLIDVHEHCVYDFKLSSGWAVKDAVEKKSDWRMQLSALAMLAREGNYFTRFADGSLDCFPLDIQHGKIVLIARDWTAKQAERNRDFAQKQVTVIDMDIMSDAATRNWLDMKIEALTFAKHGGDVPCTDEERWAKPGGWAVYKGGNVKAAKVEPTEDALSQWIFANRGKLGSNYRIEERPTVYNRCSQYCAAAPFCRQHQETKTADGNGDE